MKRFNFIAIHLIGLWGYLCAMQPRKLHVEMGKDYVKAGINCLQRDVAQDIWGQRLQRVQSQDIIKEQLNSSPEFQATIGRMQQNLGLTDAVLIEKAQRLSDNDAIRRLIGPRYYQLVMDYVWAFARGDTDSAQKRERRKKFSDNFAIALIPLQSDALQTAVSFFETLKKNSGQPTPLFKDGYNRLIYGFILPIRHSKALKSKLLDKAFVEWMNEILKQYPSRDAFCAFLRSTEERTDCTRQCFVWFSRNEFMTDQVLKQDITNIIRTCEGPTDTHFSQAVQQFQAHQQKQ